MRKKRKLSRERRMENEVEALDKSIEKLNDVGEELMKAHPLLLLVTSHKKDKLLKGCGQKAAVDLKGEDIVKPADKKKRNKKRKLKKSRKRKLRKRSK